MGSISLSDELAEETLVGLMLTGREDVYAYADAAPADFENVYYRLIWHALTPLSWATGDRTPEQIVDLLDACGLIEPAQFAVPLVWYVRLMEKAIGRTHAAMHKENIELDEAVTWLSLRVRLAAANRIDQYKRKTQTTDGA